jgi:hypothetical protein
MITSVIQHCSVSSKNMALGVIGKAKYTSKNQRVYRFFRDHKFNYDEIAKFILNIFGADKYIIALDRTCWKFGKSDINVLFLVIIFGNISVPIYWYPLDHGGACPSWMMEEILMRFINNFGIDKIKYLLADREFMSKEWLSFLTKNQIKFAIPLRKDMLIRLDKNLQTKPVGKSFNDVKPFEYKEIKGILWSHRVTLSAYRNDKNELMVVAASGDIDVSIFALYKYRWAIERLFKHLKSSGFDIEKSHITDPDRFVKLVAVCAIASAMIIKNGLIQHEIKPIKIRDLKNKPRLLVSFFTYGFDHIKTCLKQTYSKIVAVFKRILEYDSISDFYRYFPTLLQKL